MLESNHVHHPGAQPGIPAAVLLRESYRENGKVKTRTLANLTRWPEHKVDRLDRALKGLPPADWDLSEAFDITRSLPHGHVAAVLGTAAKLGIAELIDPTPSRNRDLVCAMLIATVIAPGRNWRSRAGCAPRPPPAPWVWCWVWRAPMRTTCMRRWTGRWPVKMASKPPWPHVIWPMAPWCSMTCPRRRSRATPARWGDRTRPRRRQGSAPDRLWAAVLTGRGSGRDRGV
ncbi:putative transposase [Mycobacterium xenopi 3993]|nr:putative transposase [Mycobacterium xenopi 3993]